MHVELSAGEPSAIGADLTAAAVGARAAQLGAPERATADADPVAMVYTAGAPLAVVALQPEVDGLRTAAARAGRACRGGGAVAWAPGRRPPPCPVGAVARTRRGGGHGRLRGPPLARR